MRSHEILSFSDEILRFPDISAHFSPTWRMAPLKIRKTWPKDAKKYENQQLHQMGMKSTNGNDSLAMLL